MSYGTKSKGNGLVYPETWGRDISGEDYGWHREVLPLLPKDWISQAELKKSGINLNVVDNLWEFGYVEKLIRSVIRDNYMVGVKIWYRVIENEELK